MLVLSSLSTREILAIKYYIKYNKASHTSIVLDENILFLFQRSVITLNGELVDELIGLHEALHQEAENHSSSISNA